VLKLLARWLLALRGWRVEGTLPDVPRCIVIFAPHTSNWDFLLLLLGRTVLGRRVSYLAKHTLFRPPFGWFFRLTSGIPVKREGAHQLGESIAAEFGARSDLWLAMAPEGTRAKTDHWKSGFYYIALEARVPVLLTGIDGRTKRYSVGPLLEMTGDVEHDLQPIRAFYAEQYGIYPENRGEVRFK
jgi:1-acyl-sn-glycerol-3-phosphate acyltransferase